MHSLALKINVSKTDQEALNKVMESCGYAPQKRKFHCTFGFIEKMIPEDEADSFGQTITQHLQAYIDPLPPIYEVGKAAHIFGHVIAFEPTPQSRIHLEGINLWLSNKVNELSEGRFTLNEETKPGQITPHMTLWRTHRADQRLQKLETIADTHPSYHLTQAGYVVF